MEGLYNFLYYEIDEAPSTFGLFHLCSLVALVIAVFSVIKFYSGKSDRAFRMIMFAIWLTLVIGEIYREICFSVSYENGTAIFDYAWYQFPFQLCSSPLYALPFVIFLPDGRLRDGFAAFLATFSLFGGLAVMAYPGNVMIDVLGISIQSMVHHGLQVLIAFFVAKRFRERYNASFINKGIFVFLGFLAVAMILNVSAYLIFKATGIEDTFNMFYVSPFFEGSLPILSTIQENTSGWLMLPLYTVLFVPTGYFIFHIEKWILDHRERKTIRNMMAKAKA